ncbi:ABC transporter permease [Paenibacillus typhae]|uniref:Putative ABC transport system permease protein n=1 Tax=Paenibacillus typhae TaxID=1174501 RepID=A0A1G8F833_9BACL|nr:FtsX-like permease family protein [Paenibacillus typhae]SDH78268.1 putative ABC transport system permease protein [Paenibacillus typhae]
MIINKRIRRELAWNKYRYGALFFLVVLSVSIVVSLAGAADSVFHTVDTNKINNIIEDGEFEVIAPLSSKQESDIRQLGVILAENFYMDGTISNAGTLRLFKNREIMNIVKLDSGSLANSQDNITVDKNFARSQGIALSDLLKVNDETYVVTGIGSAPDYSFVLKNPFDVVSDPEKFSIGFISEEAFKNLSEQGYGITYNYGFLLTDGASAKELKEYIKGDLTFFIEASDNTRIDGVKSDSQINKSSALIAGVIVLILVAYMISIFVAHNLDKESSVIGALYALGYRKKDLIKHYMILPCFLVFAASLIGVILGYLLIPYLEDTSSYYSIPSIQPVLRPYLIVYGIAIPLIITWTVNILAINRKLSTPPLQLLRKEKNYNKSINVNLGNIGFILRFRIRQFLREMKANITIVAGLILAILLMVFSFGINGTITNYVNHATEDAKYSYMYAMKYPLSEIPAGAEEAFVKPLYSYLGIAGKELEINLLGIRPENPYFKFTVGGVRDEVYISNAVAYKYGLGPNDTIDLRDSINDKSYTFKVKGVVPYSPGLYIFADIKYVREVFMQDEGYYNILLSANELKIDKSLIASVITLEDIAQSAAKLHDIMKSLISLLLTVSIVIFILVLYLLLKMMVDKAISSIALIKMFGYNEKEVRKLYLGNTSYTVALAVLLGLPLSTWIVKRIWPYMISNIAAGFESVIPFNLYLVTIGIVFISYITVQLMLARHIKQISLLEVLRSRE